MIVFVFDATHANIASIPANAQAALYTTGTPDIKATAQDFNSHPGAIRICQDGGSDVTADILDVESSAATDADVVNWLPKARMAFTTVIRPGQRWPGVYKSLNGITSLANALVAAHITNVPLWVADWGLAQPTAIQDILNASGPFPIVGMQIANQGARDFSVFSDNWINHTSVVDMPSAPPGQWKSAAEWTWQDAAIVGAGMDGKFHAFNFNGMGWNKVV